MKKPGLYLYVKNELFLLYLKGIRGIFESGKSQKSYNFYPKVGLFLGTLYLYQYIKHQKQFEFDQRVQPNILIPKFIYQSRREHYVYWEISRLARGKSTTFTHIEWDKDSRMIYYIDKKNKQNFEKNIFSRERLDIAGNPLFEKIMRADSITPELQERGNRLIAYTVNLSNRYDLDNYLQHKGITLMDTFRAIYYKIWLGFYISNKYRYEHFIYRPDIFYEFEKIKIAINLQGKHQDKLSDNYLKSFNYYTEKMINFLSKEDFQK